MSNTLYYGDNLEILQRHINEESIDLVYLDPPFNSQQVYNVFYTEKNGKRSQSQAKAFDDTWSWDERAAQTYERVVEEGGRISEALQAFRRLLGDTNLVAYLTMMAPRLAELRRVLKSTGSIYLHCDPTASHYLKVLMDAIFGPKCFRNDIIWKRTSAHSDSRTCGNAHDNLLLYSKTESFVWNKQHQAYDESYVRSHYRFTDSQGRRYRTDNLTAGGLTGGGYEYEWNGVTKVWRCPKERMAALEKEGRIRYTESGTAEYIRYLDEMSGVPLQDMWQDIAPINPQAKERLGYPTQKPAALLERIITASSNEGDLVLDPFCGCGTTIAAAHKLGRRWIGIDITHVAITLIKNRLQDAFEGKAEFDVVGAPVSESDAELLAKTDAYQFQWWAVGLLGGRAVEQKKGADKGIDGRLYFHDDPRGGKTKQIIVQVKSGHATPANVRELIAVVDREKAQMGVLLTMHGSTPAMRTEAASAGTYKSPWREEPFSKIQIITIGELLAGKRIDYPPQRHVNVTFKKAPKELKGYERAGGLF